MIRLLLVVLIISAYGQSQSLTDRYSSLGEMFIHQFSSAPFPHPMRANGHLYGGKTFSVEEHYKDSSVAIFVPNYFKPAKSVDIVVYFHGWNNNLDSACAQFQLIEQFAEAKKNAIFVFPEGPKDSPDSFGGKLEEKDGLKNLVNDVLIFLKQKKKITHPDVGKIILAGHSGAYRVISFCLMRGGVTEKISDVILFDALYGQTEKFAHWSDHYKNRFIDIYTDSGGTKSESELLMTDLEGWRIPFFATDEKNLTSHDLVKNRLIFIHSDLSHNEVIAARKQFLRFLETSRMKPIRAAENQSTIKGKP